MSKKLTTKFGTAKIDNKGYWCITTYKEGNHRKFLHRLIYEDYYGVTLLKGVIIHHKDGNKLNNKIDNLEAIYRGEHQSLHTKGKKLSEEAKQKISKANKGNKHSKESCIKQSETFSKRYNKSGYYRVSKNKKKDTKQGFIWRYSYHVDGKQKAIVSIDLKKLEEKVKAKGLKWFKVEEEMI